MNIIEVKGLTKSFNNFFAVDRIDFNVIKGEIFGFLGPNGAGKTTTIRMLCGILKPTAGSGSVVGFDIYKDNEKIKKHIGYMSQRFSLYPDLTVHQNIDFFGSIYGLNGKKKKDREEWALDTAGLQEYTKRIARDLPIGFKQRLGLVCALLHEPRLVFLDEPTAGVDPNSRRSFWDLIYYLKEKKETTIFVTTHYMDEAEHCERIALIRNGRITALDEPKELKRSLRAEIYVVQGQPGEKVKTLLEKKKGVLNLIPFGIAYHVFFEDRESAITGQKVLEEQNVRIEKFEPISPSLEDVFIAMVEKNL